MHLLKQVVKPGYSSSCLYISCLIIHILPKFSHITQTLGVKRLNSLARNMASSTPPIAVQKPHKIAFGAVPGENRGEKPFTELRYRSDPWFWLRDDTRKNEESWSIWEKKILTPRKKQSTLKNFKRSCTMNISHIWKKQTKILPFRMESISITQGR